MAPDEEGNDLCWEMVSDHRGPGVRRLIVVLIIRGQLMVKLNEALGLGHLRALVMTKFWPIFRYGVLRK